MEEKKKLFLTVECQHRGNDVVRAWAQGLVALE
jgi:hypothetical protein